MVASPRRVVTGAELPPRGWATRIRTSCMSGIHVNLLAVRRERQHVLSDPNAGGARIPGCAQSLAQGGDRLSVDPGHQAADAELRSDRLAGRPGRVDHREVPHLVGLRRRNVESAFSRDHLLANIGLYWFTGAIGSSFYPYFYFRMHRPWPIPHGGSVGVPTGYAAFPREIVRPPRSVAERTYTDIRRWIPTCRMAGTSQRWSSPRRWRAR